MTKVQQIVLKFTRFPLHKFQVFAQANVTYESTFDQEVYEEIDQMTYIFFSYLFCRFELKKLLTLYKGLVEFIEGSPVYQDDLERICASKASAIFLLANKDTNVCANPNTTHAYDIKK